MSVSQILLPLPPHRNQQLFADYYLNMILPQREDWQQLTAQSAPALQAIQAIYAAYTPSSNEAQTEDGLIKPVLLALGHTFEIQAALKTPDGTKKPDYVIRHAVAGMLPKTKLGEKLLKKLRVYADDKHPHTAQKPTELKIA